MAEIITVRECKCCHHQWDYTIKPIHECPNCNTSASSVIGRVAVEFDGRGYRVLHEVFDPEIPEGEGICPEPVHG